MVKRLGSPFSAICFIDEIKQKIAKKFKRSVDLCDTTSMPLDKKINSHKERFMLETFQYSS